MTAGDRRKGRTLTLNGMRLNRALKGKKNTLNMGTAGTMGTLGTMKELQNIPKKARKALKNQTSVKNLDEMKDSMPKTNNDIGF